MPGAEVVFKRVYIQWCLRKGMGGLGSLLVGVQIWCWTLQGHQVKSAQGYIGIGSQAYSTEDQIHDLALERYR